MAAWSDFAENKIIDAVFRGQALGAPATLYVGLFTAAPSDAGGGVEVTGGSYARVAVVSNLANWAGTQAAASTVASSGTSGTTSNNAKITFPPPPPAPDVLTSPVSTGPSLSERYETLIHQFKDSLTKAARTP